MVQLPLMPQSSMAPPLSDVDLLKYLLTHDDEEIRAVLCVNDDVKKIKKELPEGMEYHVIQQLYMLNVKTTVKELHQLRLGDQTTYFQGTLDILSLKASILFADFFLHHKANLVETALEHLLEFYGCWDGVSADGVSADGLVTSTSESSTPSDTAAKNKDVATSSSAKQSLKTGRRTGLPKCLWGADAHEFGTLVPPSATSPPPPPSSAPYSPVESPPPPPVADNLLYKSGKGYFKYKEGSKSASKKKRRQAQPPQPPPPPPPELF